MTHPRCSACVAAVAAAVLAAATGFGPVPAAALVVTSEVDLLAPQQITFLTKFCFDTYELHDAEVALAQLREAQDTGDDSLLQAFAAVDTAALIGVEHLSGALPQFLVIHNDEQLAEAPYLGQLHSGELPVDETTCAAFVNSGSRVWRFMSSEGSLVTRPLPTRVVLPMHLVVWQTQRPRFWYISAVNCFSTAEELADTREVYGQDTSTPLQLRMTMTNPGGVFRRHFSKDEQGMLEARIAALCIYMPWCAFLVYIGITRFRDLPTATGFRVTGAVVTLQTVALIVYVAEAAVFARTGVASKAMKSAADVCDAVSEVLLMILLVVLMKGWTMSRAELRPRHKYAAIVVCVTLLALYMLIMLWSVLGGTPASSLYLFDSLPGVLVVLVRLVVFLWFVWSVNVRLRKTAGSEAASQAQFYRRFAVCSVLWYVTLPLTVGAAEFTSPWNRARVVTVVDLFAGMAALGLVTHALWPTRVNDAFNAVMSIDASPGTRDMSAVEMQEIFESRHRRAEARRQAASPRRSARVATTPTSPSNVSNASNASHVDSRTAQATITVRPSLGAGGDAPFTGSSEAGT